MRPLAFIQDDMQAVLMSYSVHRSNTGSWFESYTTTVLRSACRNHLRHIYLPSWYCSHQTFDTVCLLCGLGPTKSRRKVARHVRNYGQYVQKRRRYACALPRYCPDGRRCGSICKFDWSTLATYIHLTGLGWIELHGVRVRPCLSHTWGRKESQSRAKTPCRSYLWGSCSNMHISFVSLALQRLRFYYQSHVIDISYSDVLRRRFQINTMTGMGYQYKSIWDAVRVIVTQEGIQGLYKGIVPNLLKVAPSMASSWLSFEITRDLLVGMREE